MPTHPCISALIALCLLTLASPGAPRHASAQATPKKIRMGIAATSVGFLPIYTAFHRGFYRDEGIDLEIILMSLAAANNAFFKGEIEYSADLGIQLVRAGEAGAEIHVVANRHRPFTGFLGILQRERSWLWREERNNL